MNTNINTDEEDDNDDDDNNNKVEEEGCIDDDDKVNLGVVESLSLGGPPTLLDTNLF